MAVEAKAQYRIERRPVESLDDFDSMEEALSVADALTEAGIYSVVTETETGPVILVSRRDLPAASTVLAKFRA